MNQGLSLPAKGWPLPERNRIRRLWTRYWGGRSLQQGVVVALWGLVLGGGVLAGTALDQPVVGFGLLALTGALVLMLVGGVQKFLLAVIILEIPIQLDVYLGHRPELEVMGALPGVNVSLTTVCLVGLYGLWLVELLTKRRRLPVEVGRLSLPLLVYFAFWLLSWLRAQDQVVALFELGLLVQAFMIFVYLCAHVRSREDVLFLVTIMLVAIAVQSLIIIGSRVLGGALEFASVKVTMKTGDFPRMSGTIGSPNTASAYLALILTPTFSLLFSRVGWGRKLFALGVFALGCVALLLTFSRGGWINAACGLALVGLVSWRQGWLPTRVVALIGGVGLTVLVLLRDVILARTLENDNGAARSRIPLMQLASRMISDHPLLGVGPNNSALVLPRYLTPEFKDEFIYVFHNKYLLVWAEIGFGALLAFLWFYSATLARGWQVIRQGDPVLAPLALGFSAALVGQLVHMLADVFANRPLTQMHWLIAGLLAAMTLIKPQPSAALLPAANACRPVGTEAGQ